MSIDTPLVDSNVPSDQGAPPDAPLPSENPSPSENWEQLLPQLRSQDRRRHCRDLFGKESSRNGAVYRWGVAAATGKPCDALPRILSRLATASGKVKLGSLDLDVAAAEMIERIDRPQRWSPAESAAAILWASAMPALAERIEPHRWWRLLTSLQQLHESTLQRSRADTSSHLMLGGELGLTLAWRLAFLSACQRLKKPSAAAIDAWCNADSESIATAIAQPSDARLVLASLLRCKCLIKKTTKRKFRKPHKAAAIRLATWVAAMTHPSGTAFSQAGAAEVADDTSPSGLLETAIALDPTTLRPAFRAALGEPQTGGRLVWELDLPPTLHHDPDAKVVVALPDWDVRRGRTHFRYSGEEAELEIFAGRKQVIGGRWQTLIELDQQEQQACGDWEEVCEYSDDDVHYIEIEQSWTGGLLLQRQLLLLRDDRCLMLADAVLPERRSEPLTAPIRYASRLPLSPLIDLAPEAETRESFLRDRRRRGLVIPLAASEWSVGPTNSTLTRTDDEHLLITAEGKGCLYAPLWFDFQSRRFGRNRTWRHLTVADQLRVVPRDEAVGYRVQIGSEQWVIYRSLKGRSCRTVLGKHLIADFYGSRFDPGDGSHDELLTVDDSEVADD